MVLVVVAGLFSPVLGFDFVTWDDPVHLTANPLVLDPGSRPLSEHLLTPQLDYPAPLTVLSYRLEYAVFGMTPWPYHLTNLLLHLGVCALVFGVGRRLGLVSMAAAAAALIVGLHPVVAEPVSWATGRKDLLHAVLVLASAYWALRPEPRWRGDVLVWILLALAIAAKPVAAFAGLAIPLLLVLQGRAIKETALRFVPIWLVIMVVLPLMYMSQTDTVRAGGAPDVSYLRAIWYALGYHLGLIFLVHPNSVKYLPRPWPPGFSPVVDLLPVAILIVGYLLYRWLGRDEKRVAGCAAVWAALAYLPYSNLLPLLRYIADAYLYMTLVGLAWFLAAVLQNLHRKRQDRLVPIAVVMVATLLALLQLPSQSRWRDSISLWSATYETFPHDYRLCRNLGNAVYSRYGAEAALAQYRECAEAIGPRPFEKNMAIALMRLGRFDEAEALFVRVLERQPGDASARRWLEEIRRRRPGP
jgi:hypothetical protein